MIQKNQSLPPRQPHHHPATETREASRSAVGSVSATPLSFTGKAMKDLEDLAKAVSPMPDGFGISATALRDASRLMSAVGFSILLAACGKTPETTKAPTPAPAPKAEVISTEAMDANLLDALAEDPKKKVAAEKDALAEEAEDIISKYPNKTATELLGVPEVNESLKVALTKLGQDKGLQNKINSTVELAARMKGLEGTPGSVRLDMDISKYDDPQKSRMLQAVLSEDPKKIVNFLVEEIGEASPELSYGGAERASNGVSIKENTPPAK